MHDPQSCQAGLSQPTLEVLPMHDLLVAAAFLLMVILPCIVTMGSGTSDLDGEDL